MHMNRKSVFFLVLAILSTIFIFSNSCKTAGESTVQSGIIVDVVAKFVSCDTGILTNIIRKLAHMIEFLIQSVCVCLFINSVGRFPKYVIYALFTGLLTACTDEFLQLFFDGRGSMVADIFIDFSGTIIGAVICCVIGSAVKHLRLKHKSS